MKNKSSSVNSMKFKKAIAASLAILILVAELHLIPQQLKAQSRKILPQQLQAVRLNRMKN